MFKMCKRRREVSGHIIVEMAVLLPIIVLFMVWMVFFMVFLLDMAVVKSEVIRISDEAAAIWDKDGDLPTGKYKLSSKSFLSDILSENRGKNREKASARLTGRMKARLMLTKASVRKVSVGRRKVMAQASVRFRSPFSGGYAGVLHGLEFTGKGVAPADDWKEELRSASAEREWRDKIGKTDRRP